jgi:hypothetical protein
VIATIFGGAASLIPMDPSILGVDRDISATRVDSAVRIDAVAGLLKE